MHLKDILFAIANFLILFGALFFITRKMISRMFRERKEKIAGELDKAKKAEESAAALENQVNRDNELARQQEKQLLEDTQRQVEKNRVCAAGDSQAASPSWWTPRASPCCTAAPRMPRSINNREENA